MWAEGRWSRGRRLMRRGQFSRFLLLCNGFPNSPPQPSKPRSHARQRKWPGELPGPSWSWDNSDGTIQGNPTWQLSDRGWSDISGNKGSVFPGRGNCVLAHPVSSAWASCLHGLPALAQTASPLWAWCLSVVPMSPPSLPVVLRWEVTVGGGGGEGELPRGERWPQVLFINPGPTKGLPKSAPRCGSLDLGHGANVKTREFFSSRLLFGSDTRVLTSAKNCPFSVVLTASLPAVRAVAKRCNFHSDTVLSQKKKEKTLQVVVSMRLGRLVCAREQMGFFLLRKQRHGDSLVCGCEGGEHANGGGRPGQP